MNPIVLQGFSDELRKLARVSRFGAGLTAAAGGLTAYDLYKSRGLGKERAQVQKAIKGGKTDVVKYVKKHYPEAKVVSTKADVKAMTKKEFGWGPKRYLVRGMMGNAVALGNNAFFLQGPKTGKGYIVGRGKMPKSVVQHEIGHAKDFKEKGYTPKKQPKEYGMGGIRPLLGMAWKPYYKKTTGLRESEAWKHVPTTAKSEKMRALGESTYDKAFHANRGTIAGTIAAGAAYATIGDLLMARRLVGR